MYVKSITIVGNKIVTITKEHDSFDDKTTMGISCIANIDGEPEVFSEDGSPMLHNFTIDADDFKNSWESFDIFCDTVAAIVEPNNPNGHMNIICILGQMALNSLKK